MTLVFPRSPIAPDLQGASLEFAINNAALWLATCPPEMRRDAWHALCDLVSQRSESRVREMEEAQGLVDRALDKIDATRIHGRQTLDESLKTGG